MTDPIQAAIDVLEKAAQMIVSEMELSGENEEYRLRKASFISAEIEQLRQFQRDKIVIDRADVPEVLGKAISYKDGAGKFIEDTQRFDIAILQLARAVAKRTEGSGR